MPGSPLSSARPWRRASRSALSLPPRSRACARAARFVCHATDFRFRRCAADRNRACVRAKNHHRGGAERTGRRNLHGARQGLFPRLRPRRRIERIDSLGKAVAFLATNQVQVAQGGINAGFYNSVAQGLPVALALESGSSPTYHEIVVRPSSRTKSARPRISRAAPSALSSPGSTSIYEVASVLALGGADAQGIEIKNLAFSQMAAAMTNGALDAAMDVAPFTERMIEQNIGVPWVNPDDYIKPLPMTASATSSISIGHAQNPEPPTSCSWRWPAPDAITAKPIITGRTAPKSSISSSKTGSAPTAVCSTAWPGRPAHPNGNLMSPSILDIQCFFSGSVCSKKSPAERLVDRSYAARSPRNSGHSNS